jgi:hypothetical protein
MVAFIPRLRTYLAGAAIAILGLSLPANAALISVDLVNPGDGLITRDTDMRLDWLDINAVMGLSYTSVRSSFLSSAYSNFHGFSIAHVSQLRSLFQNANAVFPMSVPGGVGQAWINPHAVLNSLVGSTRTWGTSSAFSVGYVMSDDGLTPYRAGLEVYFQAQFVSVRVWTLDNPLTTQVYSPFDAQGIWAVRATPLTVNVPVPAPASLLLIALLGLFGLRTRKTAVLKL